MADTQSPAPGPSARTPHGSLSAHQERLRREAEASRRRLDQLRSRGLPKIEGIKESGR